MTTAARPRPGPPREYHFPHFERRTLANGIPLIVAPVHKLPLLTAVLLADAGALCDPSGREGLASLTAKTLLEGGGGAGAGEEFAERFERLGASIEASADWDTAAVTMTVMATRLEPAFALLGELLTSPRFPEREVERLKAERQAELLQLRTEPRGLANEMFSRFLYDPRSRYAAPEGGSQQSVAAVSRDDLLAFFAERYRPGAMTLVIAGDVDVDDTEALANRTVGALAGGRAPAAATVDRAARQTRAVHVVTKDDAPQSELRVGHVGLPRAHADYYDVVVMNAILGGLFSSRINLNLREVHGYTYGASSYFDWRRYAGPFVVSSAVKSDVTDAAAREVVGEIERIRRELIAPDELSLATSYLDGIFPIRYETTSAIAAALANLAVYALPDDYYDTYRMRIRGVTREDVRAAADRHLHPEQLQMVVVGDPAVVREPLERLGVGPITIYTAEGNVVE